MTDGRDGGNDGARALVADQIQFGLIFIMTFILLLAAALVALLLPWKWARSFERNDKRWFFGRAWEDAGTLTEISFMG
jgi:hypothetical protein